MKNFLCFIILWFLVGFLTSCRAKLDTSRQESQRHIDEIGVVLRRLDSLGSTIAERQHFKIEFYPIEYGPGKPESGSPSPTAPTTTMPAAPKSSPLLSENLPCGGMGAVKSIEITTEKTEDRSFITATDSVLEQKCATTETRQEEKASEARHDNGTVLIVAVAAAVVLILALLIILKKLFSK